MANHDHTSQPTMKNEVSQNILLLGIVPANNTKEPHKITPHLELVVDELLYLSNRTMYDSYQQAPFKVKVDILIFILDYPGIGKVMNVTGSGAVYGVIYKVSQ